MGFIPTHISQDMREASYSSLNKMQMLRQSVIAVMEGEVAQEFDDARGAGQVGARREKSVGRRHSHHHTDARSSSSSSSSSSLLFDSRLDGMREARRNGGGGGGGGGEGEKDTTNRRN